MSLVDITEAPDRSCNNNRPSNSSASFLKTNPSSRLKLFPTPTYDAKSQDSLDRFAVGNEIDILEKEANISEITSRHRKFIKEAFPTMLILSKKDEALYYVERVPPQLRYSSPHDGLNRWYKRRRDRIQERQRREENSKNSMKRRRSSKAMEDTETTNYRRLLTLSLFMILFIYEFNFHVLNKVMF